MNKFAPPTDLLRSNSTPTGTQVQIKAVHPPRKNEGIFFLFATASRPTLRPTQPPIQWVVEVLSPRVKRPEREPDYSSTSSADVKNGWSYISTPQYAFIAWYLVNPRDNFTLLYFTLR
jgi:hypothetical protein